MIFFFFCRNVTKNNYCNNIPLVKFHNNQCLAIKFILNAYIKCIYNFAIFSVRLTRTELLQVQSDQICVFFNGISNVFATCKFDHPVQYKQNINVYHGIIIQSNYSIKYITLHTVPSRGKLPRASRHKGTRILRFH